MQTYDFENYSNQLDHDKIYENIQNSPWYHDAVYELFSPAEFERRHAALRQAMAARGFDCLIVPGGQSNWSQGAGMTWLSGLVDSRSMAQYVVFPREGTPLLVYGMGGAHVELMRRTVSPLCRVYVCSRGQYAEVMVDYIRSLGLDKSRIGILECIAGKRPEFPPQVQMQALQSGLPDAKLEFVSGLFHSLALLKSDEEIEARGRAGALAVAALQAVAARAAPGVTEHALVAAATQVILAHGGRVESIAIGSTRGNAPDLPAANLLPSHRKLERSALVLTHISAGFMGTTAHIGQPISVGRPATAVNDLWQVAADGFARLENCLQPDAPWGKMIETASVFRSRGYQCAPLLLHGLDIGASGPRVFVHGCEAEAFEQVCKTGMVVVLRPNVLEPQGRWGIGLARTYAITPQGHRCLTPYPLEIAMAGGARE